MEKTQSRFKQRHRRTFWAAVGVLLMSIVLTGCGTLQTLVQKDGEAAPLSQWVGNSAPTVPATTNIGDGKAVSLYFPDPSGKYLVKEQRTLPKTVSLARETINEWLKGPADSGKGQVAVPPKTTLLDIAIKDGVATVDLSKEFTQPLSKVSQEATVYGLVNTLTQFPTVREVKLRIEGKPLTKLGNLDLSKLSYQEKLVKESAAPNNTINDSTGGSSNPPSAKPKTSKDSPSTLNLFSVPPSAT